MKNLKNLTICILLLTTSMLSGCFNIVEEITLRKDGSGSYTFTIDGKDLKNMAEGFTKGFASDLAKPDSVQSSPSASDTLPALDKFARLKSMNGISNVTSIEDKSTMTSGVTFEFANLQALKTVMDSLSKIKGFGAFGVGRELRLDGKNLYRDQSNPISSIIATALKQQSGEKGGPDMSSSASFMRMLFGSMTFKQVYHFPDRKIKKCNEKNARISKDKHSITILEQPFKDGSSDKKSSVSTLSIRLK